MRHGARLEAAAAVMMVAAAIVGLARASISLEFDSSGSSSSSGDGEGYVSVGEYVAQGLAAGLADGERRLSLIERTVWTEPVCDGQPLIMLKSDAFPPNGGCLAEQTQANLSCTCLSGFKNSSSWEFRLRSPTSADAASVSTPVTQNGSDDIAASSVMTIDLPSEVQELRIVGVMSEDSLVPVAIAPALVGSTGVALARSQETPALKTMEVSNLDFSRVPIASGFLPTSIEHLSIRNCNVSAFSNGFLDSFDGLQTLNVSSNNLSSIYSSVSSMSPESTGAVRSIDLANNNLTTFPSHLLQFGNLQMLNVSGNPITNFTVSTSIFNALTAVKTVVADTPSAGAYNCSQGEWKTLKNLSTLTFCVVNSSTIAQDIDNDGSASGSDSPSGSNSKWNLLLVVAAIGGCLIGFVLLFVAVRLTRVLKARQNGEGGASNADPLMSATTRSGAHSTPKPFDTVDPQLVAELENDPIMITYRIPYRDLRVAKCISKGGFGLVYSGVYDRRRVAIKKIHPDRCTDVSQIRQFVREITLMATLSHPRIIEFIGVAWDSVRELSAVTEYMERGDLRDVLHTTRTQPALRDPRFTWMDLKLKVAIHIAEGLAYLHSLSPRVIHRDLKSKNVLLNTDMDAKLSDFGISRERRFEGDTHMTAGIGTSFWIAPEILLGRDYDERADIYSFGVVLSEIDTDDYPYWNSGNVPPETVPGARKRQENDILKLVAVGKLRPTFYDDCPKEILALAATCLEGKPEDRPSAMEVVASLERIASELKSQVAVSPASVL